VTMARTNFMDELERVRADILTMATRVEEDLRKAAKSLREGDVELAAWVKADDRTINAMQENIQYEAAILMATQQPVAQDLRELVSAIRVADNLERMGDYAVHLAKTAIKLKGSSWPRQFEALGEMADVGCAMVRAMANAYDRKDVEAASACAAMDERVDSLHHRLMAMTLDSLRSDSAQADEAIKLIRTSGFLERFADHVTNSCELVDYMVSGTRPDLNE
jgi:phosphate transport system protein